MLKVMHMFKCSVVVILSRYIFMPFKLSITLASRDVPGVSINFVIITNQKLNIIARVRGFAHCMKQRH